VLSGEDRRRNMLSSLFGVVGRDTGGVGGTSPVASAKLSNACMNIRSAASADIDVMSHFSLLKVRGESDLASYVESSVASPVSALGSGGGGGVRGKFSPALIVRAASDMPQAGSEGKDVRSAVSIHSHLGRGE
jgi:hypothetical protein